MVIFKPDAAGLWGALDVPADVVVNNPDQSAVTQWGSSSSPALQMSPLGHKVPQLDPPQRLASASQGESLAHRGRELPWAPRLAPLPLSALSFPPPAPSSHPSDRQPGCGVGVRCGGAWGIRPQAVFPVAGVKQAA